MKQPEPEALPLWASPHQPAHATRLGHTWCGSYSLACLELFRKGWVYFCLHLPQDFWHQMPLPMPNPSGDYPGMTLTMRGPRMGQGVQREGSSTLVPSSWFHSLARAPSHVPARNSRPNLRSWGRHCCPGTSSPLRSGIFRAQRKILTPLAVPIGQERLVVGKEDDFSCFLLEDNGSSSVGSTATPATQLKGPAHRKRRGAQRKPPLFLASKRLNH